MQKLADDCDGVCGTLEQAISELDTPRLKTVRGMASFKGDLMLGNPEQYESALSIQVERYYRTYAARPPAASSFALSHPMGEGPEGNEPSTMEPGESGGAESADQLTVVRNARAYQVDSKEAAGGKLDVERDDLAKGYEYGRTAVHISQSEENITKLETEAALEIIGFIPSDNVSGPSDSLIFLVLKEGVLLVRPLYEHVYVKHPNWAKDQQ